MPNTLAHIAVQWPISRWLVGPNVDPRWVLAGVVIPDLPWIAIRALRDVPIDIDPVQLRAIGIALASLFVCTFAVAAFVCLSRDRRRTAVTLTLGCVLHLVLDATQTKWGNGVQLFAPVSWVTTSWAWYWPESPLTVALTAVGFGVSVWLATRAATWASPWKGFEPPRAFAAASWVAAYLIAGVVLGPHAHEANCHDLTTLTNVADRPGRSLTLDRAYYHADASAIETFAKERISLVRPIDGPSGTVSIQGTFAADGRLDVDAHRRHRPTARNTASIVGLAFVAWMWLRPAWTARRARR